MSVTSDAGTPTHPQYVDYDEYVAFQLEKTRSTIKATDIFTTVTWLAAAFVGYLLLFVVVDQWVIEGGFSYGARVTMLSLFGAVFAGILVRQVILPLIKRVHPLYAAKVIEKADPNLKSNLLNFVDLREATETSAKPDASTETVVRAMEKRAAVELSKIDVDEAVDRRPLLRVAYSLLAVVVISALYIVFSPKDPFTSVKRALLPTSPIEVATETTISEVTPGDATVPARSTVTIEADVRGKVVDHVQILFTTADHKYVDQPVDMRRIDENLPRFTGTLNGENGRGLLQDLTYRVAAGDARTKDYHIQVIQPPSARADSIFYDFLDYMQIGDKTVAGGDIDGWEGTTVTLTAKANKPVKSATIHFAETEEGAADGEQVSMQVADGTKLTAKWKLEFRRDGTFAKFYFIQVKTDKGETDPDPTRYAIRIRPDQKPEVALLAPTGDLVDPGVPLNGIIPLIIQATDPDFRLRSLYLFAELEGQKYERQLFDELGDDGLGQTYRGKHDFRIDDLTILDLKPGKTFQFWIEARDNKQPSPNRSATPRLNVRIIDKKSAQEIQEQLAKDKKAQEDQIARADNAVNEEGRDRATPGDSTDDPQKTDVPMPPKPGDKNTVKPPEDRDPATPEKPGDNAPGKPEARPADAGKEPENQDRPQPKRDNNENALQKLLEKQQQQQPNADRPPPDKQEEQKPERNQTSDKSAGGSETKSGDKSTRPGSKPGDKPNDKSSSDPSSKQSRTGQPDKSNTGTENKSPTEPEKGAKPQKNQGPKNSPSEKTAPKPGDKTEPPEKTGTEPGKPGETGEPNPEKTPGNPSKPDKTGMPPEKPEKGEQPSKGEKPGDKPKPGETGKPEKSKPGAGEDPTSDPGNPEKPNPDAQSGDKLGTGEKPKPGDKTGKTDQPPEKPQTGEKTDQRGSPDKSSDPSGEEKPGEGSKGKKNPGTGEKTQPGKKSDSPDAKGEEEPADDSGDAQKKKADGTEKGPATGDDKPDPDAARASENVQKKPGSKSGTMKPSDPAKTEPGEKRKPNDEPGENSRTGDDPDKAKPAPQGKTKSEQPGEREEPPSQKPAGTGKKPGDPKNQRPGEPPDAGNQQKKGEGRKNGQKSEQPDTGEDGQSAQSDQGKKGGNKPGEGDTSDNPGDGEQSAQKTGKPGEKPGKGSKSAPSDKGAKSGSKPGESSESGEEGKPSDSGEAGSKSAKSGGKPGSKGSKPGQAGSNTSQSAEGGGVSSPGAAGNENNSEGDGDGNQAGNKSGSGEGTPSAEEEEKANLEFARKATNLVLKRLQEQLERGEIDKQLMDELGWKNLDDVKKFTQYLESRLNERPDDNSPEAVARRLQFEEFLKSLQLGQETTRREGGTTGQSRIKTIGGKNLPVPAEYREQYEAFTRGLSKQKATEKPKGK